MTAGQNAPDTVSTIIPTLRYRDAPAAIDWLCNTFGFEAELVVPGEEGSIAHAQLTFGNGMIMLGSAGDGAFDDLQKPPTDVDGVSTQSPYVIVTNPDQLYTRVVEAGARIVYQIEDQPHGGRFFSCRDPEGHLWNFGSYDPWADRAK